MILPLLNLLFPSRCVFCREFVPNRQAVCTNCNKHLPFCHEEARQTGEFYAACVSPLFYTDTVRDSHHRYKFNGHRWYAKTYAPFVAKCIAAHYTDRYDLITWVPLSKKRRRKRGYDQAELLAHAIAAELNTEAVPTLQKTRDTTPLSSLGGKEERKATLSGAYTALDGVSGKRILLIDDIITTGTSLSECARCLLMAGAEEVLTATLARSEV